MPISDFVDSIRCEKCGGWMEKKVHPSSIKGFRIVYFCKKDLNLVELEEGD